MARGIAPTFGRRDIPETSGPNGPGRVVREPLRTPARILSSGPLIEACPCGGRAAMARYRRVGSGREVGFSEE